MTADALPGVSSALRKLAELRGVGVGYAGPVALDDCHDTLRWVAGLAGGEPLVVGGDSAGGNLAAVCALRARTGGPLAGVRIVEFAGIGPGPFACMMLADMGAELVTLGIPVDATGLAGGDGGLGGCGAGAVDENSRKSSSFIFCSRAW